MRRIVEGDANAAAEPLTGTQTSIAEYSLPGPAPAGEGAAPVASSSKPHGDRIQVVFRKLRLQPSPGVASHPALLARWVALLQPHNPTMVWRGSWADWGFRLALHAPAGTAHVPPLV